jgi:hypothetical protein
MGIGGNHAKNHEIKHLAYKQLLIPESVVIKAETFPVSVAA